MSHNSEVCDLMAENGRLRAVLEQIANRFDSYRPGSLEGMTRDQALAALAGKEYALPQDQ